MVKTGHCFELFIRVKISMFGELNQNNITGKTKHSRRTVQQKLLVPFVCVSLSLVVFFTLMLVYTQKNALEQSSLLILKDSANGLANSIEAQSRVLIALENIILTDVNLPINLQKNDRHALFTNYKDTFARLQKDYAITHFYFHLPDRVNLLRVHKKEKYGDIIDRFTLFDAQRTGQPAFGIELDALGTFTLRAVQPVFLNDIIVGYIELGKEIDDILISMNKGYGVEFALSIYKYRMNQSQWEAEMAMLDREANWNRFGKKVLVYTSMPDLPVQWESFIEESGHIHDKLSSIIKHNNKSWHFMVRDISDASETEVGDLFIFVDISKQLSKYRLFTALTTGAVFIILLVVLFLIFRVLQHTDKIIVTQQLSMEKSENSFRSLFNSITDLIYTMDMNGNFTSANPAMHKLFGYEMDEFIGRRATEFMSQEFSKEFNTRYLEVVKNQGFCEGVSYYYRKDKTKIYIEYKSSLVTPPDGEPYISGMGRDITQKILSKQKVKELQEQVMQAQKMESIGTLAGGIAHDFNNILFPVMGYTEMLLNDFPQDSPTHKNLTKIYAGALRARDLVRQILEFSRQESGQLKIIQIALVIKEALKLMESSIPGNIEIIQDIDKDCSSIKGDSTRIHQVIMNLVTNACYAMEETGGKLAISLKEIEIEKPELINPDMLSGVYTRFTISDTGSGMDKDLISKIFVPFFTTKEKSKGTGMGLSVVHGIVIGMGGGIKVESEIGKGTQFHVYLPAIKSESEPLPTPEAVAFTGGSEHILLVDDEEATISMEKEILERLGYKITSRTSSIEALEVFRAVPDRFDLIITDLAMPNMEGNQLSIKLLKIRPDIPILLCTGFGDIISREKAVSIGIKDFLLKPVLISDFAKTIRKVLDENVKNSDY
jgi:PAS domain S-box-containing protein